MKLNRTYNIAVTGDTRIKKNARQISIDFSSLYKSKKNYFVMHLNRWHGDCTDKKQLLVFCSVPEGFFDFIEGDKLCPWNGGCIVYIDDNISLCLAHHIFIWSEAIKYTT